MTNREELLEYKRQYREKNKAEILLKAKEYRKNNKEKINEYNKQYNKRKELTDPLFKLKHNIRENIRQSIKKSGFKKNSRTEQILDCVFEEFKLYLESKFEDWMNWDNYGNPKDGIYELNKTWDIDHIIPTSSATTELELLKLNHYSNLQPLCSYNNRFIKSNNLI